jgi:uncharacterized repeat protein (TIGR03803 family)
MWIEQRIEQNSGWSCRFRPGRPVLRAWLIWLACALAASGAARAATETIIHNFGSFPRGANPYAPLVHDASGDLYGTTFQGGRANVGVVFKLSASGQTVLHSFAGGADGANPYAGVKLDAEGNLYGTTYVGGTANFGVVYKLSPTGQETLLHTFTGGSDGGNPYAGVILDVAGNLYGTASTGGTANAGVVYKLDPATGQETVLYNFTGGADGANPYGGVIADADGNLYGTTHGGGSFEDGVVYKLSPSGVEKVLYNFGKFGTGGGVPADGVVRDSAGNLYGTATTAVYKLTASGQYTVLAFPFGCRTGGEVWAGVVLDAAGNLYGTSGIPTYGQCLGDTPVPNGAVYKLDTAGQLSVLYRFPGASRPQPETGAELNSAVMLDSAGNLYGATSNGGLAGMVYKLDSAGQETTLYSFPAAPGGTRAIGPVIGDSAGNLYGTTQEGGTYNRGVLYKVDSAGKESALYNFTDGVDPFVARDSAGNLYGAAGNSATGLGEIYKLSAAGEYSVLYSFTGGADGSSGSGVIVGPGGNLYGVSGGNVVPGLVFKLSPSGQFTVLYAFTGGADGSLPNGGLILDSAGNLYGTTNEGGLGTGVVYKLDPSGQETVLHSFTGGADGGDAFAGVIRDAAGNLYGTTAGYGELANGNQGSGVVFELDAAGNYTVLYTFTDGADGGGPEAGVVRDSTGNLYGTTTFGGSTGPGCTLACGVVYKLAPSGQETVLHSFSGADGANTEAGVIRDAAGNLYGTCPDGGISGWGVLYKVATQ